MHVLHAFRSHLWCAVVLRSTLVVWGALEAALEFALSVRVRTYLSYCIKGKKEGVLLRDPEFRPGHRCCPVSTDDGFTFRPPAYLLS
jgi:hypothetical protein